MPVTGAKQLATAAPFGWLKGKIWGLIFANFSFLRNGTLMLSHKECNKKSERIWQHGSSHSSHRSGLHIFDRKQEIFSSVLFSSNPLSQFVQAKSLNWMVVYTIRPHTQLRTCLSYGPCQTPTLWFCVERHKDFWGQSWNSAFCFTLVQSVEEIQETAGFNFKKWCHTRSPEKGSDLIWWFHPGWWHRSPSRNIFWGVEFRQGDDSESPFWSPGIVKVSCLIRVFGYVS